MLELANITYDTFDMIDCHDDTISWMTLKPHDLLHLPNLHHRISYYSRMSVGLSDWIRRRHDYIFTNPLADNFCADASCSLACWLLFVFSVLPFIRYPFFCLFPFLYYRPCLAKRTRLHCTSLLASSACGRRMRAR